MQSSARGHRRLRLVDDDRTAGVHRDRHRDVVGDREVRAHAEDALDLLDVELDLGVRVVQHQLELRAGDGLEVELLHPDLQVLDARDVHAADEQHVVRRLDDREHVLVEHRRQVDHDVTGDRLQRGADVHHLARQQRVGRHRLDRRRQHEEAGGRVLVGERLHELEVAVLHRGGGVEHGVLRLEAEHHRHVTELQVAVDEHDRLGRTLRHRRGDVDGDAGLADATLGGEHRDETTGRRPSRAAGACARVVAAPASSSPTRSTDWWRLASPPMTTASRAPARSACWSTSVESSYTANTTPSELCELVTRCTCWKPIGLAKPGPKTATTGRDGSSRWIRSSIVSNCAAPESSTASRVRRFGSGSTTATS